MGIHTYHNKGSFTPNKSGSESEKGSKKTRQRSNVILTFASVLARCGCEWILTFQNRFLVKKRQWNTPLRVTSHVKLLTEPSLKFIVFNEIKARNISKRLWLYYFQCWSLIAILEEKDSPVIQPLIPIFFIYFTPLRNYETLWCNWQKRKFRVQLQQMLKG